MGFKWACVPVKLSMFLQGARPSYSMVAVPADFVVVITASLLVTGAARDAIGTVARLGGSQHGAEGNQERPTRRRLWMPSSRSGFLFLFFFCFALK